MFYFILFYFLVLVIYKENKMETHTYEKKILQFFFSFLYKLENIVKHLINFGW